MNNDILLSIIKENLETEKKFLEVELKTIKLERGIETLQERIKIKDEIIEELKSYINFLRPQSRKQEDIKK